MPDRTITEDAAASKPEPHIIEAVLQQAHLALDRAVMLGGGYSTRGELPLFILIAVHTLYP